MRKLAMIGDTVMAPNNVQGEVVALFRTAADAMYDTMIVRENTVEKNERKWDRKQLLVQREGH